MSDNYCSAISQAAIETVEMVCMKTLKVGESYQHKRSQIDNSVAVHLGLMGQLEGYVFIRFSEENAKAVVSAMMGSQIEDLDDMAISALSELGNMIVGGASTHLADVGVITDITPPTILQGTVCLKQEGVSPISIPLISDTLRIVIDVAIKEK